MEESRGERRRDAVFGGGCFWCLEAVFADVIGVEAVESGYCGGSLAKPSYEQICDGGSGHAEVVRVVFDPEVVSYRSLLEIFFTIHDPTTRNRQGNDIGTQYRSVIFAQDEAQMAEARAFIEELGELRAFPSAIVTELKGAERFWPAEAEHQNYFASHAYQPYCQYVVAPKLVKFREKFHKLRKPGR
ncbi:MAG: peptide-methionine (S)-S-oxide reductase MsrA [Rhodocyclaceae bacterium]|jgi:peptide-methionine (S)-S-oxide reductase|nr:peptide-methionine (S)-S-oxide reductase MsrA [Rhodocyclaceae bacterium]